MGMYWCDVCDNRFDDDLAPLVPAPDGAGELCPLCADNMRCSECNEPAEWEEDTHDDPYANGGKGGTHRTGNYSSKCCGAQQ